MKLDILGILGILGILEGIYIYYFYCCFKTIYSFHHPFEYLLTGSDVFKHPINTGLYENKICPFGHWIAKLLVILLLIRSIFGDKKKLSKYVVILVAIGSLLMNINAFIYLIPIFIIESRFV